MWFVTCIVTDTASQHKGTIDPLFATEPYLIRRSTNLTVIPHEVP